jgi:hypothetical protein
MEYRSNQKVHSHLYVKSQLLKYIRWKRLDRFEAPLKRYRV